MEQEAEIIFEVTGGLARVILNRPKALNALTADMVGQLDAKLTEWAKDSTVRALVIRGEGSRAFCAGGDIRRLYDDGPGARSSLDFYWVEYRCNARIRHFTKPYIAFLDGIVMGGGVGVSVHGSHRVVTENTVFAMPETGIGLFPDVGGSYFLPRCPGEIGMYLALTGARLKAADCIYAGVGTHYVPAAKLDALEEALLAATADPDGRSTVSGVMNRFAEEAGEPPLAAHRAVIDKAFGGERVEDILAALDAEAAAGSAFAEATAATLRSKSPTSLKITFRQIREGAHREFDDCMRMEYRMVNRVILGHDFFEGIRAVVIDKDQKPAWRPATLETVSNEEVEAYFLPLTVPELAFDWDQQTAVT